jgi:hypothetical protein
VASFADWHNQRLRHSGAEFVKPQQRHTEMLWKSAVTGLSFASSAPAKPTPMITSNALLA